jgi:hypothetical protein
MGYTVKDVVEKHHINAFVTDFSPDNVLSEIVLDVFFFKF